MFKPPAKLRPSRGQFSVRPSAWLERADSIVISWKFLGGLFIFLLVYLWYGSNRGMNVYDEGLICTGAETVLRGGLPYRDFWSIYGPGEYYLLAGLFKLFGTTLLTATAYTVVVEWLMTILAYLLGHKLTDDLGGLVSCITVAVWLNFDRAVLYPIVPALLFVLAGFLILTYSSANQKLNIVAGLLVGCAVLVRHDLGVYAFVGLSVTVFGERLFGDPLESENRSPRFSRAIKQFVALSMGTAAVVLPVFFALLHTVPHQILYETFIDFPIRTYAPYRSTPLSMELIGLAGVNSFRSLVSGLRHALPFLLSLFVPLLVFCLTAVFVGMRWLRKNPPLPACWLAAGMTVFGFSLFYSMHVRPDRFHAVAAMVVALILFPWLLQTISTSVSTRLISRSLRLILVLSVSCVSLMGLIQKIRTIHDHQWIQLGGIQRASGILIPAEDGASGLAESIQYIQRQTSPDQFIYVGNRRHDLIGVNNGIFYFLSDRASATRYIDLLPGVATTARVQSEIINDLKSHNVSYVVLCTMPLPHEPNKSSVSSGITILDDFIRNNYQSVAEFGSYSILHRSSSVSGAGY